MGNCGWVVYTALTRGTKMVCEAPVAAVKYFVHGRSENVSSEHFVFFPFSIYILQFFETKSLYILLTISSKLEYHCCAGVHPGLGNSKALESIRDDILSYQTLIIFFHPPLVSRIAKSGQHETTDVHNTIHRSHLYQILHKPRIQGPKSTSPS